MYSITYTLSATIKTTIQELEDARQKILLAPLMPKTELQLRWSAKLNRIYWALLPAGNKLSKKEVAILLGYPEKRKLSADEQMVIGYASALTYISQQWTASKRIITPSTVLTLYHIVTQDKRYRLSSKTEQALSKMLEYLQMGVEHPILVAGIAQMQLIILHPFPDANGRVAKLLCLLFLYKHGYDVRGLWTLSQTWGRDKVSIARATETAIKTGNVTQWLEYFIDCARAYLEKIHELLELPTIQTPLPESFWELNERQKKILMILENPSLTITNRRVQQLFHVSQITASRDLAKLTTLQLIFSRGKGRSVAYMRV